MEIRRSHDSAIRDVHTGITSKSIIHSQLAKTRSTHLYSGTYPKSSNNQHNSIQKILNRDIHSHTNKYK